LIIGFDDSRAGMKKKVFDFNNSMNTLSFFFQKDSSIESVCMSVCVCTTRSQEAEELEQIFQQASKLNV
jgi:hypothetical protein